MGHFSWLGHHLHIDHHYIHVAHSALVALVLLFLGLVVWLRLRNTEKKLVPHGKLSLTNIFEVACEGLLKLMEDVIGPQAKNYFPFVASLFIFIFFNNLLGVIPGFLPPTDNFNTTLGLGIGVFIYFNYVGLKTQGMGYLKHFMGPVIFLAPLMFVVEMIGIFVRPVSLGLRLAGNMTGDHMVLGIFSDLVPLVVPVAFLALGVFVSFIQAFVFSLLTTIYIDLSLPHGEHH